MNNKKLEKSLKKLKIKTDKLYNEIIDIYEMMLMEIRR